MSINTCVFLYTAALSKLSKVPEGTSHPLDCPHCPPSACPTPAGHPGIWGGSWGPPDPPAAPHAPSPSSH